MDNPLGLRTYSEHAQLLLYLAAGSENDLYKVTETAWFSNGTCTISSEPYVNYVNSEGKLIKRIWLLRFLHTYGNRLFMVDLVSCVTIVTNEFSGEGAVWDTVGLKNQMPIALSLAANYVPICDKIQIYVKPDSFQTR